MLGNEAIGQRLHEMMGRSDPSESLWPENCAGSRKAIVIFVGPSPGGKKEEHRRQIRLNHIKPLWNEPYNDPLGWSAGFKKSFLPIVEALFGRPYSDAAKLIARVNMDWLRNPESREVSNLHMWEGCAHILPVIYECKPELLIPMDEKTFGVLQIALYNAGFGIVPPRIGKVKVRISGKDTGARYHNRIMAFKAIRKDHAFLVIKSLQHPARIYDSRYASRVGKSIRSAAEQIWSDGVVVLNF